MFIQIQMLLNKLYQECLKHLHIQSWPGDQTEESKSIWNHLNFGNISLSSSLLDYYDCDIVVKIESGL